MQPALHRLTEDDVLFLHLVYEPDEVAHLLVAHGVGETVVVDSKGMVLVHGYEEVERGVAGTGVDIDCKVWPEKGIEALAYALTDLIEVLPPSPGRLFDGASLRGKILIFGDPILSDVYQVAEAWMGNWAVIALQIVVHDDLPVGGDLVGATHAVV